MNSFNKPIFRSLVKFSISFLAIVTMFSCGKTTQNSSTPSTTFTRVAVVATQAPDWGSGSQSIVNYSAPRTATNDLFSTSYSTPFISSYGKYFYRIEGYGSNNVTKFSIDDPSTPIWQFSTEGLETNSNPYQMVFVNDTKAYLIRYGSPKVWIVNPSATKESEFRKGELDLSAYSNCDGSPEANSGIIANNKLFIAMQRLCSWAVSDSAYIAVFDVNTNTEINTGQGGTRKGIELGIRNPTGKVKYYDGYIYIPGEDGYSYGSSDSYAGIQKIDASTYIANPSIIAPNKYITNVEVISSTKGYFTQYNIQGYDSSWGLSYGDTALKSFNPQTGDIDPGNVAGIDNAADRNLQDIVADASGLLWIADASLTNPGIYIIDPTTDTIQEGPISTDLNPLEITFCEK